MKKIFLVAVLFACGFIYEANAQAISNIIEINRPEFLKKVVDYTKSDDWVYKGDKPAIVYFTATWCGPCKVLAPVLEQIATEYRGKIYVYKIDIDKERELASKFNITAVPTIIFSPVGGVPEVVKGALPKEEIVKRINSVMLK